jgi:hypothetical protein
MSMGPLLAADRAARAVIRGQAPAEVSYSAATRGNTAVATATQVIRAKVAAAPQIRNRQSKTGLGDGARFPRRQSAFREWRPIPDPEKGPQRRGLGQH